MPNNFNYADDYILAGEVVFSANNVTVPVTEYKPSRKGDLVFMPTTEKIEKESQIYVINKDDYEDDIMPGSMFVGGLRDVSPFEGYITYSPSNKPAMIGIREIGFGGGTTDIDIPQKNDGTRIWVSERAVFIDSDRNVLMNIYSASGTLVRTLDIHVGINTVKDLNDGLYIIGNKKVIVK